MNYINIGNIKKDTFERYYICHPSRGDLAWSGSRWVRIIPELAIPTHTQICNFDTIEDAKQYMEVYRLELMKAVINMGE